MQKNCKVRMPGGEDKLSTIGHWSGRWSGQRLDKIAFDPGHPSFRDLHDLFSRTLPKGEGLRFLEVGCHPGHYMWYFHRFFGYKVSGLEYVEDFCARTRKHLENSEVPGDVICNDLFTFSAPQDMRWDIVASFGLVEHFQDVTGVIRKHLGLLKAGGFLALVIPNHQGIYGRILKKVSPEKYGVHNLIRYEDMLDAVKKTGDAEIIEGGYYGRLGFWTSGLYPYVKEMGKLKYFLVRTPLWGLEYAGRILPNSAGLSPNAAIIVRKPG